MREKRDGDEGGDEGEDRGDREATANVTNGTNGANEPNESNGTAKDADADPSLPEPDDPDSRPDAPEPDALETTRAPSVYAASHYYPSVPVRYRVERLDAATIGSSSRSLYVEDLDYVLENGRRYCGDYMFPNDELEQDRLRVLHQVFLHVFGFALTSVPLADPRLVLDIGTGTGEWAIGMGEAFPACEVVGVDISAIQPTAVPHNVFFEIDDCQIEWMRPPDSVDLVHLRDMAGAFADWDFVFREARACLRPGTGHLEVLDFHDHTHSRSYLATFPPDARIHAFVRAVDEAGRRAGRRRGAHHLDPARLRRLGFVDVRVRDHVLPLNPRRDSAAKLWLVACLHAVEATALRLLTRHLAWDPADALAACDAVCHELKTRAMDPHAEEHMSIYLRILTARKPAEGEAEQGDGEDDGDNGDGDGDGDGDDDGDHGDDSTVGETLGGDEGPVSKDMEART